MAIYLHFPIRRAVAHAVATAAFAIGVFGAVSPSQAVEDWPDEVRAKYKVHFGGFEIGEFRLNSTMKGKTYELKSSAKLSVLLGAFKWKGSTHATGVVKGGDATPAAYEFDYRKKKKDGKVRLGFTHGSVSAIELDPPAKKRDDIVPLKPKDMQDVLDPLSAVLALTHGRGSDPCTRRIPIFDGKARFDLVFTPAGQKQIESRKSGQPAVALVCHVKYEPIAGHKRKKDESKDWMTSGPVEVALRPVPSANLYVPYSVTIPTFAGAATVITDRVEIIRHGQVQIALTQ